MRRTDPPYADPVFGGFYAVCDHWMHEKFKAGCDACRCDAYVTEIARLVQLVRDRGGVPT